MNPGTLNISSGTVTGDITIRATDAVPKTQNGRIAGFGRWIDVQYNDDWSRYGWDANNGSISPKTPLAAFVKCYKAVYSSGGDSGTVSNVGAADPFIRFDIASEYLDKFNACTNMIVKIDNVPYRNGICYEQYTIKRSDCVQAIDGYTIFGNTHIDSSCKWYADDYSYYCSAGGGFTFPRWENSSNLVITVTFS